jgi:hypothetical protein
MTWRKLRRRLGRPRLPEIGLPREEWDFSNCPNQQLEACFFYETARECPHAIAAARLAHQQLTELEAAYGPKNRYCLASSVIDLFKDCPEFPETPFLCISAYKREQRLAKLSKPGALIPVDLPGLIRQLSKEDLKGKTLGKTIPYLAGQGDIAAFFTNWRYSDEKLFQSFRQ